MAVKEGKFKKDCGFNIFFWILAGKILAMFRLFIVLSAILVAFTSCSHYYFIVRHAEKATQEANMSSDVPLTDKGKERAEAVKEILKNKKIAYIFSTNTIRTRSTAQPTADYFHLTTEVYGPGPDSAFINLLRSKKKNTLVVGHSNTVDDVVNMLCGKKEVTGDLPDAEYNKLFIVKKKGKKFIFNERTIYPEPLIKTSTPRF